MPRSCLLVHGSVVQDVPFPLSTSATVLFLIFLVMVVFVASDVSPGGSFFLYSSLGDCVFSLAVVVSVVIMGEIDEGV